MRTLASAGYSFYHYGAKADAHLRRCWHEPHPPIEQAAITAFAHACREAHVRFGIALTPIGSTHPFDDETRAQLSARIATLDAIGLDDLVILFDDLRGDLPKLARAQADIVHFCADRTNASRIFFCPTYYSTDPVLDRVFGQRPAGYLQDLGRFLDPAVRVYWTGEEVCSREVGPSHLRRVAAEIGRPVCLWDNYPVNDGARMSRFLHLRAFTGRPPAIAAEIVAHAINPAIQAVLTCIPALTLPAAYRAGDDYAYGAAFAAAACQVMGDELAAMLGADIPALQDIGLERLGDRSRDLRQRYAAFDHPGAREIVRWLDGEDLMTDEVVRTQ
jgi:hypothetical protein